MSVGPHEVIDGARLSARPRGSAVKDPLRRAIWKFSNFRKKIISRFSAFFILLSADRVLRTRNVPRLSPLGVTVWELKPPKDVIFADFNWPILRKCPFYFRVTFHVDSLSTGTFSAIFRMGVKGSEHPQIDPEEIPVPLNPLLTHLECPHTILALVEL